MARRNRTLKAMDQINLTSMLDLTFVLLLAFMIIAPSLRPEVKIDLPQDVESPEAGQADQDTIIISIGKKEQGATLDRIYLTAKNKKSERVQDMDELIEYLKNAKLRDPKTNVTVEVDRAAPSESLIRVIGACRAAGIDAVSIPIDEKDLVSSPQ